MVSDLSIQMYLAFNSRPLPLVSRDNLPNSTHFLQTARAKREGAVVVHGIRPLDVRQLMMVSSIYYRRSGASRLRLCSTFVVNARIAKHFSPRVFALPHVSLIASSGFSYSSKALGLEFLASPPLPLFVLFFCCTLDICNGCSARLHWNSIFTEILVIVSIKSGCQRPEGFLD